MSNKYLVVGATSGIGFAITNQLLAAGHEVWAAGRREVHPLGDAVHYSRFDAQGDFPSDFLPGVLDGVVYCPGTIRLKAFPGLKADDFLQDWEVNVGGAIKVLQVAYRSLRKSEQASVVLFSSVAVGVGMPFHSAVGAIKGAIEGLGRSLAAEWAPKVRVNVIAPSLTDTSLAASLISTPERAAAAAKRHPLQRVGSTADIANMATFLLSDRSGWMTGQVLHVDGGLSALKI